MDIFSEPHMRRARSKLGGALVAVLVALTAFATVAPTADAAPLSPEQENLADICRSDGGIPALSSSGDIICLRTDGIFRCNDDGVLAICDEEVVLESKPSRGGIGHAADSPTGGIIVDDVAAATNPRTVASGGNLR